MKQQQQPVLINFRRPATQQQQQQELIMSTAAAAATGESIAPFSFSSSSTRPVLYSSFIFFPPFPRTIKRCHRLAVVIPYYCHL